MTDNTVQKRNYLPWIIVGAFIFIILAVVGVCFAAYISASNYSVDMETRLNARLDDNKNIYAQGTQKVMEIAQVPGMYKDDLKELVTADIQGRYGPDGSKATMQWIKERGLTLDVSMYAKIQDVNIGFRDDYQKNQTAMIDMRRSYEKSIGLFWRGFWIKAAGFPKIDLNQFKPIVTTRTEEVYKKGKEDGPMKLR